MTMRRLDSDASADSVSLGVPAYLSPVYHPDEWAALAHLEAGSLAIVNPDSGPSPRMGDDYGDAVAALHEAGIRVYGYTTLDYGERSVSRLFAEIQEYLAVLNVDGVFLDQASSTEGALWSAFAVADRFRPGGTAVAINPGQPLVPATAFSVFDEVVTFEGPLSAYASFAPPTVSGSGAAGEWHLIYDVPSGERDAVMVQAARHGARYAFASPGQLPNPWDAVIGCALPQVVA